MNTTEYDKVTTKANSDDNNDITLDLQIYKTDTIHTIRKPPTGRAHLKPVASRVGLMNQLQGGALIINCGRCYSLRTYFHYWIWQIPMVIVNVILFYFWFTQESSIIIELGFLAIGTVFLCLLARDRIFLLSIYWIVHHSKTCCTKYGRYQLSRIADCIGGLHASLGVTAIVWNSIYVYNIFKAESQLLNSAMSYNHQEIITFIKTITALSLPVCLLCIAVVACPCIRHHYHNKFEILHRYLGWFNLLILVIHIIVVEMSEFKSLGHSVSDPGTIFTMLMTLLLVILTFYPWIIMHRIKGSNVEIISSKNLNSTAFIFPIKCPMGSVCKISLDFVEFHVFGITPMPYDPKKGHQSLVLIKGLGDWTNSLVAKAVNKQLENETFYIHRIKPPNFSQGLFNWDHVFALATGVGISPLIPYVLHPDYYKVKISLLWIAREHENNYPKFLINVLKPLSNITLYDSTKHERTDLSLLTMNKVDECNAEAVFILSSTKIAYDVANYVHKKRIPVFASNFDV